MDDGDYKLIYMLPIPSDAKSVLILGLDADNLKRRFTKIGLQVFEGDVVEGAIKDIREYAVENRTTRQTDGRDRFAAISKIGKVDLVLVGNLPSNFRGRSEIIDSLIGLLRTQGYIALVVQNKYGYSRILRRRKKTRADAYSNGQLAPINYIRLTLYSAIRLLKKAGLEEPIVYAPIPDLSNPSVFIPIIDPKPLMFLMSLFDSFMSKKSLFSHCIMTALIKSNIYKHLLNYYLIIARRSDV